ncbi:thioredoxin family protein [Anatilimnocola sp. NA78]|uniref:protein-disulfide reductase DsbD family protein n=1 Tax=Anatilimnocola sp. NA78 TaxID=3415683 RepID=UPI003CE4ACCF
MPRLSLAWTSRLLVLLLVGLLACPAAAQDFSPKSKNKFNFDFGGGGNSAPPGDMEVTAKFHVQKDSTKGRLIVEAVISPEWHTFSLTQPKGGSQASKIDVAKSDQFQLTGSFVPDRSPHIVPSEVFFNPDKTPVQEEQFEGQVVWTVPLELAAGVKPEDLQISLDYSGQICHDTGGCIPQSIKATAKFAGYDEPASVAGEFTAYEGELTWRGKLEPKTVVPGGKAKLTISAEIAPGWHLYLNQPQVGDSINKPTLIVLSNHADWTVGQPQPSKAPEQAHGTSDLAYHSDNVEWVIELSVPATAKPGPVTLGGFIGFQICTDQNCLMPAGAQFTVEVNVGEKEEAGAALLQFTSASYSAANNLAKEMTVAAAPRAVAATAEPPLPLPLLIVVSFAAGLLLNFMPCVFPVLGLKLISLAQQGGESRSRMIALNLSYAAGMMVIFMILAVLSIVFGLAWGEQLTHLWFRLSILILTFAMALSLFGVWEIPIPGFAASDSSAKLQKQEGMTGAFFKGLFTTILGISCSGPLLGVALGATFALAPVYSFLVFAFIGLGMASPFLALPFVPGISKILPKPGDWMETFKQVMGFILLAACVFFVSGIETELRIATLCLLVGVAAGCWWVGKVPSYDPLGKQLTAWVVGTAVAAIIGVTSFSLFGPPPPAAAIAWEEFSAARLAQLKSENRTVMVDFTADWCANCKTNLIWAIEREDVKKLLEQQNVVAVKADWSGPNPELKAELARLNRKQIPVLAFYPAGKPEDVIILDGIVFKSQVLQAIKEAGPSKVPLDNLKPAATTTAKAGD